MERRRRSVLSMLATLTLLSTALVGANCKSKEAPAPLGDTTPAKASADVPSGGLSADEAAVQLPGIDTSDLSPKQRTELVDLANDSFCPCTNKSAGGCLRDHTECKAAERLVLLGKKLIAKGVPGPTALVKVETYLSSFAKDRRKDVKAAGPSMGNPKAPVEIVEFSDFQCPSCRAAHPALEELIKQRGKDVRWVFRHFPLPQHEHALKAAQCAAWADSQRKFWELAHQFFEHQDQLDDEHIGALAKSAGLDPKKMLAGCNEKPFVSKVEYDKQMGMDLQISGTPTVFVNGRQMVGLPATAEFLAWTVDDELEWKRHGGGWFSAK